MKPYKETIDCSICETTGFIFTPEKIKLECPCCRGRGKRQISVPHPSHKMTDWRTEILAPCGTPRFYGIRHCINCELEEWKHAAGHFLHNLDYPCKCK